MGFLGSVLGTNNSNANIPIQQVTLPQTENAQGAANATNATSSDINAGNALLQQFQAQNGVQNQSAVYGQQQQLAGTLQNLANGQGPNPALSQLNQTTGQNIASQAALQAGQRGAGSNVGLIARQTGQQGAATQQNAVGQAATLSAQQQLAYTNALQQQQQALAGTAAQQVGNVTGQTQQQEANAFNQQNAINAQINTQNQQALSQQQGINTISGQAAAQNSSQNAGFVSGAISGAAAAAGAGAEGGEASALPKVANSQMGLGANLKENYKSKSKVGKYFESLAMAKGGTINMKTGGHVPGKPVVGGAKNSYSNDNVPALLSPGEIVLPRSVTKSKDPKEAAKRFVAAVQSKKGKKS